MKNIFKKFESLDDFHKYLTTNETQENFVRRESSFKESADSKFYGTRNFDEAERLFLYGDKDNADKIERGGVARERRMIKLNENRRQLSCAVTGFAPHVPNFIAGVPTNMITAKVVQQKAKVLNLVYNVSVNGDIRAEAMREVAIKMLTAIMRVEASGVRINLYVCDISESGRQRVGWLLRIKSSGQHLDVLKTAYPLTNPSMLRRHSFRFTEVTPNVSYSFSHGYGNADDNVSDLLEACGLRGAKVLCYRSMKYKDVEGITKLILE